MRDDQVPMIEGEEEFVLVQEGSQWKIFLDWAAGVQVKFATTLPSNGALAAEPASKETVVRSGDLFTVGFKVKNPGRRMRSLTRIVHRVEPKEMPNTWISWSARCCCRCACALAKSRFSTARTSSAAISLTAPNLIAVNYEFQIEN